MNSGGTWIFYFSDALPAATGDPRALLGGKGAGLKELVRAGLPVPPGFTIGTAACRRYLELGRQWPEGLEEELRENLARLEAESGCRVGRRPQPLLLAVRSGAPESMPGMLQTILNCGLTRAVVCELGDTPSHRQAQRELLAQLAGPDSPPEQLAEDPWQQLRAAIGAVFDSWCGPAAVAYRRRRGLEDSAGTAVTVQAMIPAAVSGVLFTRDPLQADAERMVIEAVRGLGAPLVAGQVVPDRFVVDRRSGQQIEIRLGERGAGMPAVSIKPSDRHALDSSSQRTQGTDSAAPDSPAASDQDGGSSRTGGAAAAEPLLDSQPLLTAEQLGKLSRLGLRVEEHFGYPADIEWAWADGQFWLLQVRPMGQLQQPLSIEALGREAVDGTPPRQRESVYGSSIEALGREAVDGLRQAAAGRRRVWVLHNLAETLPAPTPLTWDIVRPFMSGAGGFGRMYRRLGYRPTRRVCREGFLELIAGRPYADPDRLAELFWGRLPLVYDLDAVVADRSLLDAGPTRFDPERAGPGFLLDLAAAVWAMLRVAISTARLRRRAAARFEQQVLPPYLNYVAAQRARDLYRLSEVELLDELRQRRQRVLDEFGPESLLPGFAGGLSFASLRSLLVQLGGPEEGTSLTAVLVSALEGDPTFEQNRLLYDVAAGRAGWDEFLQRYGHRGFGEMELAAPRWREAPDSLTGLLDRLRHGPPPLEIRRESLARRQQADDELPAWLAARGGASLAETVRGHLAAARRLLPYREAGRHYLMMGYELIRQVLEVLARRWELGDDIYFLGWDELPEFPRAAASLRREIDQRRKRWEGHRQLDLPEVIDSDALDGLLQPPAEAAAPAATLQGLGIAPGVAVGEALVVHDPASAAGWPRECVLVCPSSDPAWAPLFLTARAVVVERGGLLSHAAAIARELRIPAVVCPRATQVLVSGDRLRVDGSQGSVAVLDHSLGTGTARPAGGSR